MANRKAVVIGLGYVGLPTAALMASCGLDVLGVDTNEDLVDELQSGVFPKNEPGLFQLAEDARGLGNLVFSTQVAPADVFVICVPTPLVNGHADISHIESAVTSLPPVLQDGNLLILESTSPPGTTEKIRNLLGDLGVNVDAIEFAYCPERVLPGDAVAELITNPRIVGGLTRESAQRAADFYTQFTKAEIRTTSAISAEIAKLVENSFRDVNVAFANEVSMVASSFGANDLEIIDLVNLHPRVQVLQPGVGVGGHCVAVDPWFLINSRPDIARMMRVARDVNDSRASWIVAIISQAVKDLVEAEGPDYVPKVACLGLTYKANSSDLRESRALVIYRELVSLGLDVFAVEPNVEEYEDVKIIDGFSSPLAADIVVGLVNHREFYDLDFSQLGKGRFLDFCGLGAQGAPRRLDA